MTAAEISGNGVAIPESGRLVRVRGRHCVVSDADRGGLDSGPQRFVSLSFVKDDHNAETLSFLRELEPGTRTL